MQLGNFIDVFLVRHVSGTHDLRSGSQDHQPSKNSVQKTIRCNSISNGPDDGRYVPETCRAKNAFMKLPCCINLVFQVISTLSVYMWCWTSRTQSKILAQLIQWNGNVSNHIGNLLLNWKFTHAQQVFGVAYECSRMKCPNQGCLEELQTGQLPENPNINGSRKGWLFSDLISNKSRI